MKLEQLKTVYFLFPWVKCLMFTNYLHTIAQLPTLTIRDFFHFYDINISVLFYLSFFFFSLSFSLFIYKKPACLRAGLHCEKTQKRLLDTVRWRWWDVGSLTLLSGSNHPCTDRDQSFKTYFLGGGGETRTSACCIHRTVYTVVFQKLYSISRLERDCSLVLDHTA